MANANVKTRIKHKHDTAANWALATNFIPLPGELIIYDADSNNTVPRFKVGDGTTTVVNLPFSDANLADSSHNHDGRYYTESEVDAKLATKSDTHDHPYLSNSTKYAGSSSAGGAATSANKVNKSLVVKLNSGSTEGTNQFTFDGSAAKSVNVTPGAIGAYTKSEVDTALGNKSDSAYGTCSTDAATAAKVVTISGNTDWALKAGSTVSVFFSNTNTAENPTLNVNGTGAKNIYYGASQITTSSLGYAGTANRLMTFVYDGTQYRFLSWGYDSNTTYTNVKLGHGYVTCSTAEATTAKVGTLSSYTLTTGGIVAVKFTNAVPANSTLNINGKGAKNIYFRGAKITNGVIKAGDVATFIYSSSYHLISIDRWQNDLTSLSAVAKSGSYNDLTDKPTIPPAAQIITWGVND